MNSILCIDDNEFTQVTVAGYLRDEGYVVYSAYDAVTALNIVKNDVPDLILLDLLLEKTSGLDFLRNMCENYPLIPIIMVSSRAENIDRIIGIEAGADDYIAKPFHPRELSARIKSVLKRCKKNIDNGHLLLDKISFGSWIMDIKNYQVLDKKTMISAHLTTKEFIVLKELVMNRNRILTRDHIFQLSHNYSDDVYERVVDIQISRIRYKLCDNSKTPKYIRTIRNVGYTFIADAQ